MPPEGGATEEGTQGQMISREEAKNLVRSFADLYSPIFEYEGLDQETILHIASLRDCSIDEAGGILKYLKEQRFVPAMVERRWGRVIMLGSFLGPMSGPPVANYSTTKAAKIAQAVLLRKNWAEPALPQTR